MVFLALTRSGLEQLVGVIGHTPSPLWVNHGVLTAEELKELREQGIDLTNFTNRIALEDQTAVASAVDTIAEHHPDQSIWVEYALIREQQHPEE
jgi:hypothetical protein